MAQTGPFFVAGEAPQIASQSWESVELMSDEFDGSELDTKKWSAEPNMKGFGWIGRPPGLFQSKNVSLGDGKMNVTVGKLNAPKVVNGKEFKYYGAIVRSVEQGQVGWYYECRMKANATEMSSTFWLMTPRGSKKRLELDIQECVGQVSRKAAKWASDWDQVFHSNLIQHARGDQSEKVQMQNSIKPETKNCERFYVYGAWWKSKREVRFYLDGKYVYSAIPKVDWDQPSHLQMAIETYDWNPVPDDGGLVASGSKEQRTTQYDWVRTWKLK